MLRKDLYQKRLARGPSSSAASLLLAPVFVPVHGIWHHHPLSSVPLQLGTPIGDTWVVGPVGPLFATDSFPAALSSLFGTHSRHPTSLGPVWLAFWPGDLLFCSL